MNENNTSNAPLLKSMGWTHNPVRINSVVKHPEGSIKTAALAEFASDEHYYLGENEVQLMVDKWAKQGLIEGGALVMDTDANGDLLHLDHWSFYLEREQSASEGWEIPPGIPTLVIGIVTNSKLPHDCKPDFDQARWWFIKKECCRNCVTITILSFKHTSLDLRGLQSCQIKIAPDG